MLVATLPFLAAHMKRFARSNVGALIIRIGLGVYSTIIILRNPQNPILIIKASTLCPWCWESRPKSPPGCRASRLSRPSNTAFGLTASRTQPSVTMGKSAIPYSLRDRSLLSPAYTYAYTLILIHIYIYIYLFICLVVHIYIYILTHIHVYIHIYIYIYPDMYVYTCICKYYTTISPKTSLSWLWGPNMDPLGKQGC